MILKGTQRGHGANLATHLLNTRDNDHVDVIQLRGVAADDLHGALLEIEATAHGTKCQQPFFQVIVNPPETANLTRAQFMAAFDKIDRDMGFTDHARVIVFHEKQGREHAHVIYSRIYVSETYEIGAKVGQARPEPVVKARNMDFFKARLRQISQDLHRDFGLDMPDGLKHSQSRDPLNFGLAEWQQSKRLGEDPRALKRLIGEAYQFADSASAFNAALEHHAMQLARGDRRGFVVLHHSGEALPLHRYLGVRQKDIRGRLGMPEHVQTIDQAQSILRAQMTARAEKHMADLAVRHKAARAPMLAAVRRLKIDQQAARQALQRQQAHRARQEALARARRLRGGLMGLWDRMQVRFGFGQLARDFAGEIKDGRRRDAAAFHQLKTEQIRARQKLQTDIRAMQNNHRQARHQARLTLGHWLMSERKSPRGELKARYDEIIAKHSDKEQTRPQTKSKRSRTRRRTRGFEM